MEKYITSIKDLVALEMANAIDEKDEYMSNFQKGMIHLLGINTPVDLKKASQFFTNSSLKNDPDANCMLGFIEECQGNYSSSFSHYALAAEKSGEKQESPYLNKVIKGRDILLKSFKKYNLPLTINEQITKILDDSNKGTAKSKLNAKIIAAYICEDEATCIDIAQELFEAGDIYSAKALLQKGNVHKKHALYDKIDKFVSESRDSIKTTKSAIVELEGESILPDYDKSLSISRIKKECDDCSKICCQEWTAENKVVIDKMIKSQKRKIAKEKAKKQERYEAIGWWLVIPAIIFGIGCMLSYHWDIYPVYMGGAVCAFFYYCVAVYVKLS